LPPEFVLREPLRARLGTLSHPGCQNGCQPSYHRSYQGCEGRNN
jgi:hypothetical protein